MPTMSIPKGQWERYLKMDENCHHLLAGETGINRVIDLIDHFSKFIMSFPVYKYDSENIVNSMQEFCALFGYPIIL